MGRSEQLVWRVGEQATPDAAVVSGEAMGSVDTATTSTCITFADASVPGAIAAKTMTKTIAS